jgi:galactosylceramidase
MVAKKVISFQVDSSGGFTLSLGVDQVWTLTTMNVGVKGSYPTPPDSKPFPLSYEETYQSKYMYQV